MLPDDKSVLLFDGVCNVCNGFVNFILDHDKRDQFRFAALQSELGQTLVRDRGLHGIDSVVLFDRDRVYTHSRAGFRVLALLGWPWKAFAVFGIFPPAITDFVYRFIAKHRYRWFGKREACRVATAAERQRFLA